MAASMQKIIGIIVGFVVTALVTPISMAYIASINGSFNGSGLVATYAAPFTIFSVLLPVLYIIGVSVSFLPHGKG